MNKEINDIECNPHVEALLDPNGTFTQYGITLLDHFAGLAMNAFLQSPFQMQKLTGDVNENDTLLAITCYRIADAMLKARKEVYGE